MGLHVFFFGDSICFGQFMSPNKIWVNRICENLHQINDDITIFNPSHSGDTTRMVLEKMPFDVQQHGIDVILIQFGINDSNIWKTDKGLPRVSKRAFEANLFEIIERARTFGAKYIFLDTNHPTNKMIESNDGLVPHQNGNVVYNQIIRKVAKESHGVQLIDMEQAFLTKLNEGKKIEDYLLEDGIHLNNNGHDLYFETIYPYFESVFKNLKQ